MSANARLQLQAGIVSVAILLLLLAVWHFATLPASGTVATGLTAEQIEYQKLLGKDPAAGAKQNNGFPTLTQMVKDTMLKKYVSLWPVESLQ